MSRRVLCLADGQCPAYQCACVTKEIERLRVENEELKLLDKFPRYPDLREKLAVAREALESVCLRLRNTADYDDLWVVKIRYALEKIGGGDEHKG